MTGRIRRVFETVAGIAAFLGFVIVFNVWFFVSAGDPIVPQLEGRWWAGYYETSLLGRQWCVARFYRTTPGEIKMALLSPSGAPDLYDVDRSTSNQSVVRLAFTNNTATPTIRIEAKQLYQGQRYWLGRLMAGRFSDFWEMNEDIAIRGQIVSWAPKQNFEIEPITEERLKLFWTNYVRPNQPTPLPVEILLTAGVPMVR
jgi:hypothetical protein